MDRITLEMLLARLMQFHSSPEDRSFLFYRIDWDLAWAWFPAIVSEIAEAVPEVEIQLLGDPSSGRSL